MKRIVAFVLGLTMIFGMMTSCYALEGAYTVKNGDVLWKIAKKNQTTWQELAKINQLSNPRLIFQGKNWK